MFRKADKLYFAISYIYVCVNRCRWTCGTELDLSIMQYALMEHGHCGTELE